MKDTIKACQEAAQILLELRQNRFKPKPSGWFTAEQFAECQNRSPEISRRDLRILINSGKFESRIWERPDSLGRVAKQTIYRKKQ